LAELAARHGGVLDFGAAAGACLPVVRLLRDRAVSLGIRALRGVFSGAANDLLGRLTTGISYEAALAEARARGTSRVDPHDDVSGRSGAEQIAVLAWLAFGCHPRTLRVRRRGLGANATDWSSIAAAMGGVVKLVAEAVETPDGVVASVEPMLVPASGALASAGDERSVIEIESRLAGTIVEQGQGVDRVATANMLFADLLRDGTPVPHLLPLPSPAISRARAPADPRELRWLMLLPREGITALDDACCAGGVGWEEIFSTTRPRARSIVALCCPPAVLGTLVGRLEGAGLRPKWIRATA